MFYYVIFQLIFFVFSQKSEQEAPPFVESLGRYSDSKLLEDLTNINKRTTVRKKQRAERLSWAFYQLRQFITYKAKLVGVPVVLIDPRNTSRTCSSCGHCEKANRKNQAEFVCKKCGHQDNAAKNIRNLGLHQSAYSRPLNNLLKVA